MGIFKLQFKNTNTVGTKKKKDGAKTRSSRKPTISKIDESYNTDKTPDKFTTKEDIREHYKTEHDNKGDIRDIPSEDSSVNASSKVRNKIFLIIKFTFIE